MYKHTCSSVWTEKRIASINVNNKTQKALKPSEMKLKEHCSVVFKETKNRTCYESNMNDKLRDEFG